MPPGATPSYVIGPDPAAAGGPPDGPLRRRPASPARLAWILSALLAAAILLGALPPAARAAVPNGQAPDGWLPDAILDPGGNPGLILVVDKARQELQIYLHDGRGRIILEKVIPCSTGMARGDKLVRGDRKTPDGFYVFNQKLLSAELPEIYGILAYPMDYPNFWDRVSGHGGDGIWTHGVNKPLVDYDSNGCVELFNHDIAALEDRIRLYDTPILVYEEVRYAPPEALREEAGRVRAFVEGWRRAWAGKDHETYASLYAEDFVSSDGMDRGSWLSHKRNVAAGYRSIQVEVEGLRIFRHRDVTVATFVQRYRGDTRYSSSGGKRLFLRPAGDTYLVAAEEFEGERPPFPDKRLGLEEKLAALTTPPLSVASFAAPVAAAGAGSILPGAPALAVASAPAAAGADGAGDELARLELETRARGLGPGRPAPAPPAAGAEDGPEIPAAGPAPGIPAGAGTGAGPGADAAGGPETPILMASLDPRVAGGAVPDASGPVPGEAPGTTPAASLGGAGSPAMQSPAGPRMSSLSVPASTQNPTVSGSLTPPPPEIEGGGITARTPPPGDAAEASADVQPSRASHRVTASASAGDRPPVRTGAGAAAPGGAGGGPGPPDALLASLLPFAPPAGAAAAPPPVPPAAAGPEADRAAILGLLADWAEAWEEKDLDSYFSFYAEDFLFPDRDMGREAFVRYRSRLIRGAGVIDVELEGPEISVDGDRAAVSFVQRYASDAYSDSGEKTLRLARRGGAWRIVSETFRVSGGRG
ncbi:MAG: nuclear transport factor 2 family protein [Deltaproteobacteria bacterium]|jgi:murein L,D-transpeptidase YafK|nr:nuclear transport factor 2 family protein [Deltaproteobacteria bacterium]